MDEAQKLPDVMFVAKFDPPLIVPYHLALQTGAVVDNYQMTTFDGLMFPTRTGEKIEPGETRTIVQRKTVPVFEAGMEMKKVHRNTLFIEKVDYGRVLTELPFNHPRKLVEILPALRQYAFLSTLLRKSFDADPTSSPPMEPKVPASMSISKKELFREFVAQAPTNRSKNGSKKGETKIDVSFTTQPEPRISLVFPFKGRTANVVFEVRLNGVVEVMEQNVLAGEGNGDGVVGGVGVRELGRMLEVTEDLGIWVEFVKRRLG